ncbi:hypothetical protein DM860_002160 [Cuscuta australis]|uniref:Uncharacterized protein n=1 Tax=Cuscuta australis TaxID=267555 RepID=A0A328DZT9_9ASTE|nr:hypothetical protein DM860_002160 [Cuscuta australis]
MVRSSGHPHWMEENGGGEVPLLERLAHWMEKWKENYISLTVSKTSREGESSAEKKRKRKRLAIHSKPCGNSFNF